MAEPQPTARSLTPAAIEAYLVERIAFYLSVPAADIARDVPVTEYGLDSVYAVALCGDIEDDLAVMVEPTLLWDVDTITALTRYLTELAGGGAAV
jgi:acyl carrier protein